MYIKINKQVKIKYSSFSGLNAYQERGYCISDDSYEIESILKYNQTTYTLYGVWLFPEFLDMLPFLGAANTDIVNTQTAYIYTFTPELVLNSIHIKFLIDNAFKHYEH